MRTIWRTLQTSANRSLGLCRGGILAAFLALAVMLASTALAGAGQLGPGDTQLQSGEYYDRISFDGNAGDQLVIELASSVFDPYLIVLDPNERVLVQEDDSPGAGLGVRLTVQLPAAGRYTIVVTSAFAGETGGYSLTISAVGASPNLGTATPTGPAAPTTPPVQAPTAATAQPRTVTGTVVDTAGRPIAGARVWIQPAITTGLVEVRSDSQGRYLASGLVDVPYNAKAWAYVDYGGRQLCLRLGMDSPVDYDTFVPTQGAVRNFRIQLTGPIEDMRSLNEHFGGMIRLIGPNAYGGSGNRLEFTFTPTGPRIDGSNIAPFTRQLDPSRDYDIHGLPVGPYQVTGSLVRSDGSRRPLRMGSDSFDTSHAALNVDWTGDGTCSNTSGFSWVYIWLDTP